jgi:hypothetical protein
VLRAQLVLLESPDQPDQLGPQDQPGLLDRPGLLDQRDRPELPDQQVPLGQPDQKPIQARQTLNNKTDRAPNLKAMPPAALLFGRGR